MMGDVCCPGEDVRSPYTKSCPAITKFALYRTKRGRIFAFATAGCDCTRVAKMLEHARAEPQTMLGHSPLVHNTRYDLCFAVLLVG